VKKHTQHHHHHHHHHYKEQKRRQQSDMGLLTELSNPAIFSSSSFLTFPMSLLPIGSCFLVHQRKNSWLPERKKGKKRSRTRERERRERKVFLPFYIQPNSLPSLSLSGREREREWKNQIWPPKHFFFQFPPT
jgi:hypothetical protein